MKKAEPTNSALQDERYNWLFQVRSQGNNPERFHMSQPGVKLVFMTTKYKKGTY